MVSVGAPVCGIWERMWCPLGCGCVGFPDGWVNMRSFRTVLLVTAIAFASACASEEMTDTGTTDPEPISETTDVSAPTSTVPEPAAAPPQRLYRESLLTEYFGFSPPSNAELDYAGRNFEWNRWRFLTREYAIEECMEEKGYPFIPHGPWKEVHEEYTLGNYKFASEWGFGKSTFIRDGKYQQPLDPIINPNGEYLRSLSYEQHSEWMVALGGVPSWEEDTSGEPPGGCLSTVRVIMDRFLEEWNAQFLLPLIALQEEIRADSRHRRLDKEWAVCMKDEGYNSEAEHKIPLLLLEITTELAEISKDVPDPDGVWWEQDYDHERLEALKQKEIRLATATVVCSPPYFTEEYDVLVTEYEQKFIEEHRQVLEEWRDTWHTDILDNVRWPS